MQIPTVEELDHKIYLEICKHGWWQQYRFFDWKPVLAGIGTDFSPRFKYLVEFLSMTKPENLKLVVLESFAVPAYPRPEYRLPYDDCKHKLLETQGMDIDQGKWNGVLVIPLSLTNSSRRSLYHRELWQSFIAYTIDFINRMGDIKWILSGLPAQQWESYINPEHLVFKQYSPIIRKTPCRGDMFKMIENKNLSE